MVLPSDLLRHGFERHAINKRDVGKFEPEAKRQGAQELLIGYIVRCNNSLPQRLLYRFATAEFFESAATDNLLDRRGQPFISKLRYGAPPSSNVL